MSGSRSYMTRSFPYTLTTQLRGRTLHTPKVNVLYILLCMSRCPRAPRHAGFIDMLGFKERMFSFAPGISGLSRWEGDSVALASPGAGSRRLGVTASPGVESEREGWTRRVKARLALGKLPLPPPKLLLLHLAIGKACICVTTRAWDIPRCTEDCIVVLCSVVDVEGLHL